MAACTAQPQQEEGTFQGIEDWGSNACAEMGTFTDRIVRRLYDYDNETGHASLFGRTLVI